MLDWFRAVVLPDGKISEHDMDMFHLTDSPAEVVDIVVKSQSSLNQLGENVSDEIRFST
jgi:predicted Rossmann-fold nucleotide-binding protein